MYAIEKALNSYQLLMDGQILRVEFSTNPITRYLTPYLRASKPLYPLTVFYSTSMVVVLRRMRMILRATSSNR